jgi:hypothetical protein
VAERDFETHTTSRLGVYRPRVDAGGASTHARVRARNCSCSHEHEPLTVVAHETRSCAMLSPPPRDKTWSGAPAPPRSGGSSGSDSSPESGSDGGDEQIEELLQIIADNDVQLHQAAEFGQTLLEKTEELQQTNTALEEAASEHEHRIQELSDNATLLAQAAKEKDAELRAAQEQLQLQQAELTAAQELAAASSGALTAEDKVVAKAELEQKLATQRAVADVEIARLKRQAAEIREQEQETQQAREQEELSRQEAERQRAAMERQLTDLQRRAAERDAALEAAERAAAVGREVAERQAAEGVVLRTQLAEMEARLQQQQAEMAKMDSVESAGDAMRWSTIDIQPPPVAESEPSELEPPKLLLRFCGAGFEEDAASANGKQFVTFGFALSIGRERVWDFRDRFSALRERYAEWEAQLPRCRVPFPSRYTGGARDDDQGDAGGASVGSSLCFPPARQRNAPY